MDIIVSEMTMNTFINVFLEIIEEIVLLTLNFPENVYVFNIYLVVW